MDDTSNMPKSKRLKYKGDMCGDHDAESTIKHSNHGYDSPFMDSKQESKPQDEEHADAEMK